MDSLVDALQRRSAEDPEVIALAGGLPDPALFPRRALAASAARVLRREGDRALQYDWPEGREGLRAWIAGRLAARGAAGIGPADVIVTNGAQQALTLIAELLLGSEGAVAIDPESYPGALDVFRAAGASFETLGAPGRARVAYTMPAVQNPRGTALDDAGRAALLGWARAHDVAVIEDDAYAQVRFDGPAGRPLLADDRDRVWHVGTLSKTLCPGIRVGWLIPPPDRRRQALERKRVDDLQSNGLAQSMIEDFLARDDFDRRLERGRRHYAARAKVAAEALRRELPGWSFEPPAGAFAIWLVAPEPGDDRALLAHAVRCGVSFDPGSMFRAVPAGPDAPLAIRCGYSLESPARLREGARRLARAWADYRAERGPRAAAAE